jgi:LmbE family N-acetylglucosaminyl deacetylase
VKRPFTAAVVLAAALVWPLRTAAQEQGLAALGAAVDGLDVAARVLVIAAHPDDEDTQLITWLARGRQVQTAYLSLTRGDGGQNLIGNELGEALGVIRTEELLAARRVDGGLQFFSRAFDFGFSKSADETFTHWPRDSVLRDVVTVIRAFRPHVVVSVFSGTPRDGHGHHQAAGILAREAYDLAGDTVAMPRGINPWNLDPWTPLKFYRGARFRPAEATLSFNVGEFDLLYGRSYAEIAAISRSQHRSQGFGALERRGVVMNHVTREHTRVPAPGDPRQERSIFDGIDVTWTGQLRALDLPRPYRQRLDAVPATLAAVRATSLRRPDSLVVRLAALRNLLPTHAASQTALVAAVGTRSVEREPVPLPAAAQELYRHAFDRTSHALALASGIVLEAEVERELVAIGDSVPLRLTVYNRGAHPIRVTPADFFTCPLVEAQWDGGLHIVQRVMDRDSAMVILPDSARTWRGVLCAVGDPTQPWWLAAPRQGSMFRAASVHAPEDVINRGPVARVWIELQGHGSEPTPPFEIEAPVVFRFVDPVRGDTRRPVAFVPRVSVLLDRTIEYAPANTPLNREVRVQLRSAATSDETVRVRIELPAGLRADSAARTVTLPAGATRQVAFRVTGRLQPGRDTIRVVAEAGGEEFTQGYTLIDYEHIRPQRLYRPARIQVEAVDVRLPPGLTVGYIPGVGDNVAPMLAQLGIDVIPIDPAEMGTVDLRRFRTVVVGPRAYDAHPSLAEHNARLLEWVRGGGTLVVQYGQWEMMRPGMTPYPLSIRRPHTRVTDETAPVQVLRPGHPLLATPNRIGDADFEGWVQERGLYMPFEFDAAYTPLLAMADPGEEPNQGAILVAPYGRGTYVYTSLAFFRQLPAGVPGAARLFVNLLGAEASN